MKHLLAWILFFFLSIFGNSQDLRIVKDNVNCSYGIKDQSGNWVIEPLYILIQQYNSGYFLVKDALGDGILSPTGKWIVPCKYDRIDVARPYWQLIGNYDQYRKIEVYRGDFILLAHMGERKFLLNHHGETLYEMARNDQFVFDGSAHIMIHAHTPVTSTYLDTAGAIFIDRTPGIIAPFGLGDVSLNGERWYKGSPNLMHGNVRVINRTGEILMDAIFEKALLIPNNRIAFENDGYYGVMSILGDTIIPPTYRRKEDLSAPEHSGGSWVIYDRENRAGLMRTNGTVIIETAYDEITPIYNRDYTAHSAWQITQNGKVGIIDSSGLFIVPMEYGKLYPIYEFAKKSYTTYKNFLAEKEGRWTYLRAENAYASLEFYDSIEPVIRSYSEYYLCEGLITKCNGKYGILNPDGTVLVDCIYSSHFNRLSYRDRKFFSAGKELIECVFTMEKIHEIKWKPFIIDGLIHIYTDSISYMAFSFSKSINGFSGLDEEHQEIHVNDDLFLVHPAYPKDWMVYSQITKRRIPIKNITEIHWMRGNRYQIQTRGHHAGVIDGQGKFIVDTSYLAISKNQNSNHIWALKQVSAQLSKWILLDSAGRQVLPNLFDEPFDMNSGDQLVSQNQKIGLLDTETLKWKIRPEQPCLWKVFDDYYYIATAANKKGIIRSNGTYALLPGYDSIVLFYSNYRLNGYCPQGIKPEIRWIAYLKDKVSLVDQNGKAVMGQSGILELKEALFFADSESFPMPNALASFPALEYAPSLEFPHTSPEAERLVKRRELWTNPALKALIFDSIHERWKHFVPLAYLNDGYNSFIWGGVNVQESTELQKLKNSCNCAQTATLSMMNYSSYSLEAIGDNFASIGIREINRYTEFGGNWGSFGQERGLLNELLNFVTVDGVVKSIQLADVFPSDSILMYEFITALQKRDDLKLNCSSLEMMIELIGGKFRLGTDGIRLYLNQYSIDSYGMNVPATLLIPIQNLMNHPESKWIVPILRTFE